MALAWSQALAWRMRRHLLEPIGTGSVHDVVRRLGSVAAQFDDAAELAIRTRQQHSSPGEVARALAAGELIKTYAFRGATQLMVPEEAGVYLALRAASRMWELPSWQSHYNVSPQDWPALLETVQEALEGGPLTSPELGEAVTATRRFRHLGFAFDGAGSNLLKPLAWQGAMSFGPAREGRATFQRLTDNDRWAGIPDLDEAGRRAVEAYFSTYGPATPDHVHYWLGDGLSAGRKRIRTWIARLGSRLTKVEIEGETALILAEDHDELVGARASQTVRLLPGYDQWVIGPGTADSHIVPPARRQLVSRNAALLVAGGVVAGTWSITKDAIVIEWFPEAAPAPRNALEQEVARMAQILDRPHEPTAGGTSVR